MFICCRGFIIHFPSVNNFPRDAQTYMQLHSTMVNLEETREEFGFFCLAFPHWYKWGLYNDRHTYQHNTMQLSGTWNTSLNKQPGNGQPQESRINGGI